MIVNGRSIKVRTRFLDELAATEEYLDRNGIGRGRIFTKALFNFLYDIVATFPEAHALYRHPLLPEVVFRRAIFSKQYIVLYLLSSAQIDFVYFHHASRDISQIDFMAT